MFSAVTVEPGDPAGVGEDAAGAPPPPPCAQPATMTASANENGRCNECHDISTSEYEIAWSRDVCLAPREYARISLDVLIRARLARFTAVVALIVASSCRPTGSDSSLL